jgi:hypothetical protein
MRLQDRDLTVHQVELDPAGANAGDHTDRPDNVVIVSGRSYRE